MTQPGATNPPETPPVRHTRIRSRPTAGTRVHCEGIPGEVGIVRESDSYMDTLQIRGLSAGAQVLVEWPNGGYPIQRWERLSQLVRVSA